MSGRLWRAQGVAYVCYWRPPPVLKPGRDVELDLFANDNFVGHPVGGETFLTLTPWREVGHDSFFREARAVTSRGAVVIVTCPRRGDGVEEVEP